MKFASIFSLVLTTLVLSQTGLGAEVQGRNYTSISAQQIVRRDDPPMAPLTDDSGPRLRDITKKEWAASWFNAMAGAVADKHPEDIEDLYKDIGAGAGKAGEKTDKSEFFLYNYKGEKSGSEQSWADVSDDADYLKGKKHWWLAGLQTQAQKMGGFLGCDKNKISRGSPVDAYKMLTGKKALMDNVVDGKRFLELLKKARDQPVVIGVGADPERQWGFEPWEWYPVQDLIDSERAVNGEQDWEAAEAKYFVTDGDSEGSYSTYRLKYIFSNVRKIVYPA